MEMNNFRPESHVAQQSRRDKLRIQQTSTSLHHFQHFANDLERSSTIHPGLNPDLVHVRNVRNGNLLYDPALLSSDMINFSMNSSLLPAQRDEMSRSLPAESASFLNLPPSLASNFNASSKATGQYPHGCGTWRSLDSQQQSGDWMVNYASGKGSNPMIAAEVVSNNAKVSNIVTSTHHMKPKYCEYQEIQSNTFTDLSGQVSGHDGHKHYGGIRFNSPIYQNTLQDVVTTASIGAQSQRSEYASLVPQNAKETGRGSWGDAWNDRVVLPSYGNQSTAINFENSTGALTVRSVENCRQWNSDVACMSRKGDEQSRNVPGDPNTQGLSLSLSSDSQSKLQLAQFGGAYESQDLPSLTGALKEAQDSTTMRPNYPCSIIPKPSIIGKGSGKSLGEIVGTSTYRYAGPLGPFTGYATILKSSKFLRPAQELLDELCNATGSKLGKTCEVPERISGEVSASPSADVVNNAMDLGVRAKATENSGISSSTYHSSNDISGDCAVGSSSSESYRPEHQQTKAKLIYLQEEVCRKYKQYHQQMQMVVSSFESVAGLSAATPYVCMAFKSVSRNFRCLKIAISDQLKHIRKALGEDLLSPTTGASSSDANLSRLKYMDQNSFQKQKSGGGNVGFLEPQQHVWRPQRGLPERSVAILRAWLFEHFLHPYPTDTDKHMLAAQTGLTRNQVSNWFINARVRVWKPMVEEIHMLETNRAAEANDNSLKNDENPTAEGTSRKNTDESMNKFNTNTISDKQLEFSRMGSLVSIGDGLGVEQWSQEKRSAGSCQVPATMDASLMGFVPYQRSGLEIGGLGAVSLTLGLRHGVESVQQQQQQLQQQEDQLRNQFGSSMIHHFVG